MDLAEPDLKREWGRESYVVGYLKNAYDSIGFDVKCKAHSIVIARGICIVPFLRKRGPRNRKV